MDTAQSQKQSKAQTQSQIKNQTQNAPRPSKAPKLTAEQEAILKKSSCNQKAGWLQLTCKGEPYEVGFQHGYHVAAELADAIRVYTYMTMQTFGVEYDYFVQEAVKLHKDKLGEEYTQEMQGIADGSTAAGYPLTFDDVLGWNAWMEVSGYWWPLNVQNYDNAPERVPTHKSSHCSAFVATGSATADGKPVIGHESFDEFWSGQYFNIYNDITPAKGHRVVMQTMPGCISSMTDYNVTDAGLAVTETTLAGFVGYDTTGTPEYVRARRAVQYADGINSFVDLMQEGNNGGYANAWLIADTNTGEIARYEQGLKYQNLECTKDGYFFGCNAVFDPRIRNLECVDNGFNDPRQQTGARRQRWMELLAKYEGSITREIGQRMLEDTYDVYLGYNNPSSRCICSHYDVDPQYFADDPKAVWNVPFYPAGSCDGKCADTEDIKNMRFWHRIGRADGVEFDAEQFFEEHPLWAWQKGYTKSRPSEPWILP